MDQNKQKLLIGALAVVALGAGSYFFFFRETSAPVQQTSNETTFVPRQREVRQTAKAPTRAREERAPARAAPDDFERRERAVPERTTSNRRTRGANEKIEAKKKIVPAS